MKRILALDGGGIRGVFSLQILARIEELFRAEGNQPGLVLADVFDYIAGTSTGAIIASFLSWGLPVREIERLYIEHGTTMFTQAAIYARWKSKYSPGALSAFLRNFFIEDTPGHPPATLGSARLRTLLLLVMRNATTGSAWPLCNNPRAKYNQPQRADNNLQIPLWQLVRASTAAPTFFPPEAIRLDSRTHLFVDGGITPYNNPALLAVLMATLPAYALEWPTGREALHVVSVGTGGIRAKLPLKEARNIHFLDQIKFTIPSLVSAGSFEQDLLCRILGDCLQGAELDAELGDLHTSGLLDLAEKKFTYVRYDQDFTAQAETLAAVGKQGNFALDNLAQIPLLQVAGRKYASEHILDTRHFYPRKA